METSKKLTGEQLSLWTSFAADTLANHLALPGNEKEQMTPDTFGLGCGTPLAHYSPDTQSWKTSEDISLWGEQPSLVSLPKSGMTRNGVLYPQPDWVRPIDATELSSWPTPRSSAAMAENLDNVRRRVERRGRLGSKLEESVAMWPTPRAAQGQARNHTVYPRCMDKPQNLENRLAQVDPTLIGGKLNPTWVEWLMGFPLGWTALED
jgi:hypothetical protein